ncbi:hypothetical protein HU200_053425 [Digitaria exilis]|uniref:PD-(D/E)XK endonuclease-like domain-containing protein n=1 Tax=Digitaria exilis TaxID=1010633 RepID=A0A835ARQ2_9POAL|nr:hypothetical protein HU200_053425 [Digitaria exilis]
MTLIGAALAAGRARPFRSTVARLAAALFSFVTYSAAGPAAGEIDYSTLPMSSPLARFRDRRALAITDITATVTPSPKDRAFHISLYLGRTGQMCSHRAVLIVSVLLAAGMVPKTDGVRARTREAGEDRGHEGRFGPSRSARERGETSISGSLKQNAASSTRFYLEMRPIPSGHCRFGVVEGLWMIGTIDEIQLPRNGTSIQPILVDTKTRGRRKSPPEAQKRNGRFAPYCCFNNHLKERMADLPRYWQVCSLKALLL